MSSEGNWSFAEGMSSGNILDADSEALPFPRRRRRDGWGLTQEYGQASNDDDEHADWSPFRRKLHKILRSAAADVILGVVISLSLVVVIVETDATAEGDESPQSIQMINLGFTVLYSFELLVRLYVYRFSFFFHWFNVMDFLLVFIDIVLKLFGESSMVSTLRIFRLMKLARVLVLLVKFPELHMILRGIYCTIKSIFWGMCLLTIIIIIWSILGVQLIHPVNKDIDYGDCERCNRAFAGVFDSCVTIFQTVVAGDSWGQLAVPIIEQSPLALAYFATVFVSISLLVLNLILATTVERAAEAKDEDEAELNRRRMEQRRKSYKVAEKRLKILCKEMDLDQSGALTLDELEDGYRTHREFRKEMLAMDIREDDMKTVFKLLDTDGSGDVNYEEFVESLHMMKTRDSHTLLMFTHHLVEDIVAKSAVQLRLLTSKRDGLVNRMSDEVTTKVISVLGPLLEKSTKSTQAYKLWPAETHDDEASVASWSSLVLPPMEDGAMQEWRKPSKPAQVQAASHHIFTPQERKPEQTRLVASALDVVPPIVPVTPFAETLCNKDGREIKVTTQVSTEAASLAASRGRSSELNVDESLALDDTLKKAKDAGDTTREKKPRSERQDRGGLGAASYRQGYYPLLADLQVVPEQLTQITTAVQRIERAIHFMGGAGRHPLCSPQSPPRGKDAEAALLQQGMECGSN